MIALSVADSTVPTLRALSAPTTHDGVPASSESPTPPATGWGTVLCPSDAAPPDDFVPSDALVPARGLNNDDPRHPADAVGSAPLSDDAALA